MLCCLQSHVVVVVVKLRWVRSGSAVTVNRRRTMTRRQSLFTPRLPTSEGLSALPLRYKRISGTNAETCRHSAWHNNFNRQHFWLCNIITSRSDLSRHQRLKAKLHPRSHEHLHGLFSRRLVSLFTLNIYKFDEILRTISCSLKSLSRFLCPFARLPTSLARELLSLTLAISRPCFLLFSSI